jgi:hypothetical protein
MGGDEEAKPCNREKKPHSTCLSPAGAAPHAQIRIDAARSSVNGDAASADGMGSLSVERLRKMRIGGI